MKPLRTVAGRRDPLDALPFPARCTRDALVHLVVPTRGSRSRTYQTVSQCDEWRGIGQVPYTNCPSVAVAAAPTCMVCVSIARSA